jgi:hypothetical protein
MNMGMKSGIANATNSTIAPPSSREKHFLAVVTVSSKFISTFTSGSNQFRKAVCIP